MLRSSRFSPLFADGSRPRRSISKTFGASWFRLVLRRVYAQQVFLGYIFAQIGSAVDHSLLLQLTRPHAVKTVKYVNPAGGTWTVAAQRIPAQSKEDMEMDVVSSVAAASQATRGYTSVCDLCKIKLHCPDFCYGNCSLHLLV